MNRNLCSSTRQFSINSSADGSLKFLIDDKHTTVSTARSNIWVAHVIHTFVPFWQEIEMYFWTISSWNSLPVYFQMAGSTAHQEHLSFPFTHLWNRVLRMTAHIHSLMTPVITESLKLKTSLQTTHNWRWEPCSSSKCTIITRCMCKLWFTHRCTRSNKLLK